MRGNGSFPTLMLLAVPTMVAALTGCNSMLVGNWKTNPMPTDEPFCPIQAEFKDDGTYQATARKQDGNVILRGTYDFNGFRLLLKAPHKKDRNYGASCWFGKILKLRHGDKRITMRKQ